MKKCATCRETKPVAEFHRQSSKSDGLRTRCKACENAAAVAYRQVRRWNETRAAWRAMHIRCKGKHCRHIYFDRGIKVCERWMKYENFLADMGEKPSGTFLDRIDNDGHYEPGNCRWVTPRESTLNRRVVQMIEWNGETRCIADWERVLGFNRSVILGRLRLGWNVADAMTTPAQTRPRRSQHDR